MSDTKNHKLAIKAIIEAHRTPGKMREIMLTILSDKPSAIVNAWGEVKPQVVTERHDRRGLYRCLDCVIPSQITLTRGICNECRPSI